MSWFGWWWFGVFEFVYFIRVVFVGMGNESEERVWFVGGDGLYGDEEENNVEEGRM